MNKKNISKDLESNTYSPLNNTLEQFIDSSKRKLSFQFGLEEELLDNLNTNYVDPEINNNFSCPKNFNPNNQFEILQCFLISKDTEKFKAYLSKNIKNTENFKSFNLMQYLELLTDQNHLEYSKKKLIFYNFQKQKYFYYYNLRDSHVILTDPLSLSVNLVTSRNNFWDIPRLLTNPEANHKFLKNSKNLGKSYIFDNSKANKLQIEKLPTEKTFDSLKLKNLIASETIIENYSLNHLKIQMINQENLLNSYLIILLSDIVVERFNKNETISPLTSNNILKLSSSMNEVNRTQASIISKFSQYSLQLFETEHINVIQSDSPTESLVWDTIESIINKKVIQNTKHQIMKDFALSELTVSSVSPWVFRGYLSYELYKLDQKFRLFQRTNY